MINTRFWDDNYIANLDPIEKLLFLYFLTNNATNICGIYELPVKNIANDTGIDKEMVLKVIERFSKDSKIFYFEGWVCLKNFVKNQNQRSPQVITGIKRELSDISSHILDYFKSCGYGIDTLSHLTQPNLTKPNLTNEMYNYEPIDEEGNPVGRKKLGRVTGEVNKMLISVGCLWADIVKKKLSLEDKDIVLKNIYYPIRATYDREKWNKEDFKKLFEYYLSDQRIKPEDKIAFDLCLSQKYVAKYKLAQKQRPKTNASVSSDIKL